MSSVAKRMKQVDDSRRKGELIPAEVSNVYAFVNYNGGWIEPAIYFERPELVIELETETDTIHYVATLENLTDGNFLELAKQFSDTSEFDVRDFIGKTVYIAPDEHFSAATLYPSREGAEGYNSDRHAPLKEYDNPEDRHRPGSGCQLRSLAWMNRVLRLDFERRTDRFEGWLIRQIVEVDSDGENIRVWVQLEDGWLAKWEFDDSLRGQSKLHDFATTLGIPTDPNEMVGEDVLLAPLRDVSAGDLRNKQRLNSLERWVIRAKEPLDPDPSVLGRLRTFLSLPKVSSHNDTSTHSTGRHARTSDKYDEWSDPARENSTPEE